MKKKKSVVKFLFDLANKVASKKVDYEKAAEDVRTLNPDEFDKNIVPEFINLIEDSAEKLSYIFFLFIDLSLIFSSVLSRCGMKEDAKKIEVLIAIKLFQTGKNIYLHYMFKEAMELFIRARDLFSRNNAEVDENTCQFNIAKVYRKLGDQKKSITINRHAREVFLKHELEVNAALCDLDIANACVELGEHEKALQVHDYAKQVFLKYGEEVEVARCDLNISNAWCVLGEYQRVIPVYDQVNEIFLRHGMEIEAAQCVMSLANALCELGVFCA